MKPFDFANLAERLIANEKNPEGFRIAISRAYYGAYLQGVEFLEAMSVTLTGTDKHNQLSQYLTHTGDQDVDEVGTLLATLRDDRNAADYKLARKDVETESVAQQCLDDSRDIIAKLNGCRIIATRFAAVSAQVIPRVNMLRGLSPPASPP